MSDSTVIAITNENTSHSTVSNVNTRIVNKHTMCKTAVAVVGISCGWFDHLILGFRGNNRRPYRLEGSARPDSTINNAVESTKR